MHRNIPKKKRQRVALWALAAVLGVLGATALPVLAQGSTEVSSTPVTYTFTRVNDPASSFNQELGINDHGVIAGYSGSGAASNPRKGYTVIPPYGQTNFRSENFPGSAQTEVTGIKSGGTSVGFYVDTVGDNIGFVLTNGVFVSVTDPSTGSSPAVNRLLGVNKNGIAVGYYDDSSGESHPYTYNIANDTFTSISVGGATSAFASGINNQNDVVGTETLSRGTTQGFEIVNGTFSTLSIRHELVPPATNVSAFGVNDLLQIVGAYTDSLGHTHGFIDTNGTPTTINEPNAKGFTVVHGINNGGSLVGFYDTVTDHNCSTVCKGFVAVP